MQSRKEPRRVPFVPSTEVTAPGPRSGGQSNKAQLWGQLQSAPTTHCGLMTYRASVRRLRRRFVQLEQLLRRVELKQRHLRLRVDFDHVAPGFGHAEQCVVDFE